MGAVGSGDFVDGVDLAVEESPLRRLPPLVVLDGLDPEVPARGRATMPTLSALTRSLQ